MNDITLMEWIIRIVTVLTAAIAAYNAAKAKQTSHHNEQVLHKLEVVINGRMTELLALTRTAAAAAGAEHQRLFPDKPLPPDLADPESEE